MKVTTRVVLVHLAVVAAAGLALVPVLNDAPPAPEPTVADTVAEVTASLRTNPHENICRDFRTGTAAPGDDIAQAYSYRITVAQAEQILSDICFTS